MGAHTFVVSGMVYSSAHSRRKLHSIQGRGNDEGNGIRDGLCRQNAGISADFYRSQKHDEEDNALTADRQDKINLLKLSNEESHSLVIESIETALLQLMRREEFDAIRVSDIVRRSGVSGSAFISY